MHHGSAGVLELSKEMAPCDGLIEEGHKSSRHIWKADTAKGDLDISHVARKNKSRWEVDFNSVKGSAF